MVILRGKNLGEKHRELNQKVIEAANSSNAHKYEVHEDKESYIENLFRIDLASRNKHLTYILQVLKSGNDFYVARALRCQWIFDDEFSDIINPAYLHNHVFLHMSQRMKKKMLTTISMHVRNEDRVICFYSYCINLKLKDLALKFLINAPEYFKMDLIEKDDYFDFFNDAKRLKQFIGNSFKLAVAYVEMHCDEDKTGVLHELRFLYFVSKEDYLDILEKYDKIEYRHPDSIPRLGIRISRDILKIHKYKIWKNAIYYINKLNKSMLVKHFSSEDIKNIAVLLLPNNASDFWSMDFYHSYKFILDLIPPNEIYAYLKQLFTTKYMEESFEMNIQFYNLNYYEMLTTEEQEAWALLHIEREEELFGSGNDYIWYKFVSFNKAFPGIKKYVFITPGDDKRSDIVKILVDTVRSQEDLKKLLNYYYERHVNENEEHKMSFLDTVVTKHDIYVLDIDCWTPLNKLFYSLEVYTSHQTNWKLKQYIMRSMIYYILNNKQFSDDLQDFIVYERNFFLFCDIIGALSEERRYVVVKYWLDFYGNRIKTLLEKPLDDKVKEDICEEICLVWSIVWCFNRDEKECPEIVLTYMKSNLNRFGEHPVLREKFIPMTEGDFIRLLKNDSQGAIASISKVMCNAYRWSFRLTRFFKKIRIYFADDVSEEYLKYFLESFDSLKNAPFYVRTYRNVKMAVVAVFLLGNEQLKISFLEKYVPENKKIDYENLDNFLLQIQKAICRLGYFSQPPVSLQNILKYITGDYLRFCLPMFNNFLVNLPKPYAFKFIYEIIDSPVSVQKHGLRLAFKCFDSSELAEVVINIWKKTKNVSLRMVLYKSLFTRMLNEDSYPQKELYEVLKVYTSKLNDQDHEDIFDLLVSEDIPKEIKGDYIETAWKTVSNFSDKNTNVIRKTSLIRHMEENVYVMNKDFLEESIIEDHVRTISHEKEFTNIHKSQQDLIKAKWDLIAAYIVYHTSMRKKNNPYLELTMGILKKCLETWDSQDNGVYTNRQFCVNFLNKLEEKSCIGLGGYLNIDPIYRNILDDFSKSLSQEELYLFTWKYKLYIKSRRVLLLHYRAHNKCKTHKYPCVIEIADAFARKLGKLVKQLVDTKKIYFSFYSEMMNTLSNVCETMARIMDVNSSGFKILVSGHLVQFKMTETHALAVMLIPKVPPQYWEKRHENVIKMLKEYNNVEIRNHLSYKFVFAL